VLVDLNDPVPLTFEVAGVTPVEVRDIIVDNAKVTRMDNARKTVRFHLSHAAEHVLPEKIDQVVCNGGEQLIAPAKLPGIAACLRLSRDALHLSITNAGDVHLEHLRIAYRLPLLATPGVVFRNRLTLAPGERHEDRLPLVKVAVDPRYQAGIAYAVAQIDFVHGGTGARLYVQAQAEAHRKAPSYPWQGFAVLGPIPAEEVDLNTIDPVAMLTPTWRTSAGKTLRSRTIDDKLADSLSVEVIPVLGRWSNHGLKPSVYFLSSTVTSPTVQSVRFLSDASTVKRTWVNGKRIKATTELRAGRNSLLLAYAPPAEVRFSPEHAGPMFRIVGAEHGQRLADITYSR